MAEIVGCLAGPESGPLLREEALRRGFVSGAEFDRRVRPQKMVRPR
jgi:fumarate hydratase class II